jgi:hypothetical protein
MKLIEKMKYQMYIDGNKDMMSSYVIIDPFNRTIQNYFLKISKVNKRSSVREALLEGAKNLKKFGVLDVDIFASNNHVINIINNQKLNRPEMLQFYKYFHRIMEGITWELIKIPVERNKASCFYLPSKSFVKINNNVIKRIEE